MAINVHILLSRYAYVCLFVACSLLTSCGHDGIISDSLSALNAVSRDSNIRVESKLNQPQNDFGISCIFKFWY